MQRTLHNSGKYFALERQLIGKGNYLPLGKRVLPVKGLVAIPS